MKGWNGAVFRVACWSLLVAAMMTLVSQWPTLPRARAQQREPAAVAKPKPAAAQAEPAAAKRVPNAPDAGGEGGLQPQSLGSLVLDASSTGLVFYVVLGLFSVTAMAVTIERLANLTRRKVMPGRFVRELQRLIGANDGESESFRRLCDSSHSPIAAILRAGTLRAGRPLPEVEKAMEDAAAREMAAIRGRNRPLSVVASVAPLVGLLGTVVGMIFAFRISSQAGLGKAELLAEGIYLALMTTAMGLTIAIPCLLLVAWFNSKVDRFMREIDVCLIETMPSFIRMERRG